MQMLSDMFSVMNFGRVMQQIRILLLLMLWNTCCCLLPESWLRRLLELLLLWWRLLLLCRWCILRLLISVTRAGLNAQDGRRDQDEECF